MLHCTDFIIDCWDARSIFDREIIDYFKGNLPLSFPIRTLINLEQHETRRMACKVVRADVEGKKV